MSLQALREAHRAHLVAGTLPYHWTPSGVSYRDASLLWMVHRDFLKWSHLFRMATAEPLDEISLLVPRALLTDPAAVSGGSFAGVALQPADVEDFYVGHPLRIEAP